MPEDDLPENSADRPLTTSTRRSFLTRIGLGAAATVTAGVGGLPLVAPSEAEAREPRANRSRRYAAYAMRVACARIAYDRGRTAHPNNGEERDYPYVANYCKGLPHDQLGEVDPDAYRLLKAAVRSGEPDDFEAIPLAGERRLKNPLAGLAFDLEGADTHALTMRPHPRIDSPECSGEMAELYWHALARDVPFSEYASNEITNAAADDLSGFSDFRGPKVAGRVKPVTLFRGNGPGVTTGPYISQFLLRDMKYGALRLSHRQQTVDPGTDFLTDYPGWLSCQRGEVPFTSVSFDETLRYIRNGRDLAEYVRVDQIQQAYFNAGLILIQIIAPFSPRNPYRNSLTTDPFATFAGPHALALLMEVSSRALKEILYQKWFVHRRLRPEEFGGRIHNHVTGAASYPIDSEVLDSPVLDRVFSRHGTYLLPQAFPDGCPMHPAYGSGHTVVAGACVTILKAFYDESWVMPDCVVPNADGTALVPYDGALTVGGELNKLAANISLGRNFAGIHWRTDSSEAMKLGEQLAITILEEQKPNYREKNVSYRFTKFDGTRITI